MKINSFFASALIAIGLIGQSLLALPGTGLPITLSWLLYIFIFVNYGHLSHKSTAIFLGINIFVLFTAGINIFRTDLSEFFRSYASFVSFSLIIFLLQGATPLAIKTVLRALNFVVICISAFTFLQVVTYQLSGDAWAWFVLDPISISTATDAGRFEAVNLLGYIRPTSVYHEPSYLALISLIGFHLTRTYTGPTLNKILFSANIVFSLSLTGIFFFVIYLFATGKKWVKSLLITILIILVLSFGLSVLQGFVRVEEILRPGTSGYERLVVPFEISLNYWIVFPFGSPLGNVFPQLNNSLGIGFCYFGVFAIPLLILFFLQISVEKIIIYASLLFTNGAFFTTEIALLVYLLEVGREKEVHHVRS